MNDPHSPWRIALIVGLMAGGSALSQPLPTGLWTSYDDAGQKAEATIRISEQGGRLVGHIVDILDPTSEPDPKCDRCPPDRRGLPMRGLQIISGVDPKPQGQVWRQGGILDPQEGREYRLELEWASGSDELKVRGYWGPFWRTQTWRKATVTR